MKFNRILFTSLLILTFWFGSLHSQPLQFSTDTAVQISCENRPPEVPSHYIYNTTDEYIWMGWNRTIYDIPEESFFLMIFDGVQYPPSASKGLRHVNPHDTMDLIFSFWHDTILPGDSVIVQIVVYDDEDSLNTAHLQTFIQYCPLTTNTLETVDLSSIKIYPNPVIDFATIILPDDSGFTSLQIFNHTGEIIRDLTVTGSEIQFSREGLSAGMYFIILKKDSKISGVTKMIVVD